MKESHSLDMDADIKAKAGKAHAQAQDDGEDPFIEFSSLTRHHDGEM